MAVPPPWIRRLALPPWSLFVLGVTVVRIPFAALTPLTPEEAYHWNFARHLDWSYLDHPPVIAWSIALGRALLGDTPLGVRLVPILFSAGTAAVLARFAGRLFGPHASVPVVLLFSLLPVPFIASGAGFPDSPLLFFWASAMALGWEALRTGRPHVWLAAGAALGGALLSKYTAVFLPLSILGCALTSAEGRRRLASPWPWAGAVLAALVFSPVLIWNAQHDWASLHYQSVGRLRQADELSLVSPFKFVAQQAAGVLGLTAPLAAGVLAGCRADRRFEIRYLLACFAVPFGFFLLVSFGRSNHLLWPVPGFLSLVVLMAGAMAEGRGRIAAFYGRNVRMLAGAAALLLLLAGAHAAFFLPGLVPFHGLYGWDAAARRARELRADLGPDAFYLGLGRKYTVPSQLAFHLRAPQEVHGKNLLGLGGLQYDHWIDPQALSGKDAVVVIDGSKGREQAYLSLLKARFEAIEPAGRQVVQIGRMPLMDSRPLEFSFYVGRRYRPFTESGGLQ